MGAGSVFWKKLWKVQIPERIKVLIWRLVKGVVPTCSKLIRRHVQIEASYALCLDAEETAKHCFVECHVARQLWLLSPLGLQPVLAEGMSMGEWCGSVIYALDTDSVEMFLIMIWCIWNIRNEVRFKGERIDHQAIIMRAVNLKKECDQVKEYQRKTAHCRVLQKWQKPSDGYCKVNEDGAWFSDQGKGSVWVVIRDSAGEFIAAGTKRVEEALDAEHVEALAFLEGVKMAKDLQCSRIIVEGDALGIVEMINSGKSVLGPIQNAIDNFLSWMQTNGSALLSCKVCYSHRDSNQVAHQLTRQALFYNSMRWEGAPPQSIIHLLQADTNQ